MEWITQFLLPLIVVAILGAAAAALYKFDSWFSGRRTAGVSLWSVALAGTVISASRSAMVLTSAA